LQKYYFLNGACSVNVLLAFKKAILQHQNATTIMYNVIRFRTVQILCTSYNTGYEHIFNASWVEVTTTTIMMMMMILVYTTHWLAKNTPCRQAPISSTTLNIQHVYNLTIAVHQSLFHPSAARCLILQPVLATVVNIPLQV